MGVQPFDGKGPLRLSQAGSRAEHGKITLSGIPNYLNYCVIVTVYVYEAVCSVIRSWRATGWRSKAMV